MMDNIITDDNIQEAANEIAGLKAYNPDKEWLFTDLVKEIAIIIKKHVK